LQAVSEVIKRVGFLKGMVPASALRQRKSH